MNWLKHKQVVYGLVALVIVTSIVLTSTHVSAIKDQLNDWKFLPQPERITELSVQNYQQLPQTYLPLTTQTFSFTIHNLEYHTMTYDYAITASGEVGSATLDQNSVVLASSKSANLSPTFTLPDLGTRVKVSATLTFQAPGSARTTQRDQEQSVHYWVNRRAS